MCVSLFLPPLVRVCVLIATVYNNNHFNKSNRKFTVIWSYIDPFPYNVYRIKYIDNDRHGRRRFATVNSWFMLHLFTCFPIYKWHGLKLKDLVHCFPFFVMSFIHPSSPSCSSTYSFFFFFVFDARYQKYNKIEKNRMKRMKRTKFVFVRIFRKDFVTATRTTNDAYFKCCCLH